MKTKIALKEEELEQKIKAGKEKLMAKKNEALEAAEKKFNKGLKALEDKFKVIEKKVKEPKAKKAKEAAVKEVKISKKEIAQMNKEGKSVEEIAEHFKTPAEKIKAKLDSLGLIDKKGKKQSMECPVCNQIGRAHV